MKFLIGFLIVSILLLLMAKFVFMKYVFIVLIALGILLDMTDFMIRVKACMKRKKVPSAIPLLGFLLVITGLIGLAVKSIISWKVFLLFFILALTLHLSIQMLFPLMFTMACNVYYRRKLFDFSPLPEKQIKGVT